MSFLDRLIATVTPSESDIERRDARAHARTMSTPGDWLEQVLIHHEAIQNAFEAVDAADDPGAKHRDLRKLFLLLAGHSAAEEAVLYPALAAAGEKGHAEIGYEEQAMAKIQLASLETLDPMGRDFHDSLHHLNGAVLHHMYEEESSWFLLLREKVPPLEQERLTGRYRVEMARFETPTGMRLDADGSEARGPTDRPVERSPTGAPPAAFGDDHPLSGSGEGAANRGMPADFRGPEVRGSGAGAGGGGAPEDFDSDPQSGGGKLQQLHDRAEPHKGGDAPIGGSH